MGAEANKALIREYFERVGSGDPSLPELLADDVEWWIPPGSELGGTRRGKTEVLEVMASAFELFAKDQPLRIELEQIVAEDGWVCVQFTLETRTARGLDYRNHYHIAFELRGDRIARVKEYVDTAYANERLMGS